MIYVTCLLRSTWDIIHNIWTPNTIDLHVNVWLDLKSWRFNTWINQRFYFFSFTFLSQNTFSKLIHYFIFAVSDDWSLWIHNVCCLLCDCWIFPFHGSLRPLEKNIYHHVRVRNRSRLWRSNLFKLFKVPIYSFYLCMSSFTTQGYEMNFVKLRLNQIQSFTKIQSD